MSLKTVLTLCCSVYFISVSSQTYGQSNSDENGNLPKETFTRIVALAPHLSEWVYALNAEDKLVGVSAYSDYPKAATSKPIIADANGINFKALISLKPDLVLVWEGGNKRQDLERLTSLGFKLFYSAPTELENIGAEIYRLGNLLNSTQAAKSIQERFNRELEGLRNQYQASQPLSVFFYMWTKPLMSIGDNAWANKVLSVCNAETIFADSPSDYPEVRIAEVLLRKPYALVTTLDMSSIELESFWQPHREVLSASIIKVNGEIVNRFTPRITDELNSLCQSLRSP